MASKRLQSEQSAESRDSRVEAPLIVLVAIALQTILAVVSLSQDWKLWLLPGWVWLIAVVPELILVALLSLPPSRKEIEKKDNRRTFSIALVVLMALVNTLALVGLFTALVTGHETLAASLLLKGLTIWGTNVITFGLLYWEFDGGGPDARIRRPKAKDRDFQFPQQENANLVTQPWRPRLFDYVYTSFTNSIAFSPTDAMPLSHRAKVLMMTESIISAVAVLLVVARAVNIMN